MGESLKDRIDGEYKKNEGKIQLFVKYFKDCEYDRRNVKKD